MSKLNWKPGNMLYPVPAVMVSCGDMDNSNIITIAWAGTVNSDPPMVSISIRPERHSHDIILESGEFVVNLVSDKLAFATDYCGVKSGRDVDKFNEMHLTKEQMKYVSCPGIKESPVSIECKVKQVIPLGSHDMFIAEVLGVNVEEELVDERGALDLKRANLISYSHGEYIGQGKYLGKFGYSVSKKKSAKKTNAKANGSNKVHKKRINKDSK